MYLIAENLLQLSRELLPKDRGRPDQAVLRRAVSVAYFAVFHRVIEKSVDRIVGKSATQLRSVVARTFEHGSMKGLSRAIASGQPPKVAAALFASIPDDLKTLAEVFASLQEARHTADYDLSILFTKARAEEAVTVASQAFELLESPSDAISHFLLLLPMSRQLRTR